MITPVWRAEKHNTFRHLNEARQMDIEVAFTNQKQIIEYLDGCVKFIVKSVLANCKKQLNTLGRKLTVPKSKWISYDVAIKSLRGAGMKIKWGDDLGSAGEKKLAEIYGKNTLIHITSWPAKEKPFYIWPSGKYSEGFDTDWGGIELTSGGQRVHDPKVLEKQLKAKGLNVKNFKFYIDSFRYGAPPHSGWSIGLERITMIICGLANIREACLFPRDRDRLAP
jgi:aspartyl-tRNA synthetase